LQIQTGKCLELESDDYVPQDETGNRKIAKESGTEIGGGKDIVTMVVQACEASHHYRHSSR